MKPIEVHPAPPAAPRYEIHESHFPAINVHHWLVLDVTKQRWAGPRHLTESTPLGVRPPQFRSLEAARRWVQLQIHHEAR